MKSLTIIIPVHNEDEKNYENLVFLLRQKFEVLVIDDGSDVPVKCATHCRHKCKGYGNAIKLGMRFAKGTHVGIIDADRQYEATDLLNLWDKLTNEDMVIGKRTSHQGGIGRYFGRIFLKTVASLCALRYIPDLNSGLRIYKRNLALRYSALLCDTFSFTTSLTLCFLLDGLNVRWQPISFSARQGTKSTVKTTRHGLITLYQIIWLTIGLRTRGLRKWLRG